MAKINLQNFTLTMAATAALALVGAMPAKALTIVLNYDSSVTRLPNSAQIQGAFNFAAQRMQGLLTDPVTVNITVVAVAGTSTQTLSTVAYAPGPYTYFQIRAALAKHVTSKYQTEGLSSLPTTGDPFGGKKFQVARAEAKVLGLIGASTVSDGTITVYAGNAYATDPNNRAVTDQYDLVGIAEHDISHILGRSSGIQLTFTAYEPLDLFRYEKVANQDVNRALKFDLSINFLSLDNGASIYQSYDTFVDTAGWAYLTFGTLGDAFVSLIAPSFRYDLTTVDAVEMSVLGYTENGATAIPAINSSAAATAAVGVPFSYTITATNGPVSFGVTSGLPSWLGVDQATGVLYGIPPSAGTYSMLITASNAYGTSSTTLTITAGAGTDAIGGTPLGGGWNYSSWFGYYNSLYYPWINRSDLGFMYLDTTNNTDLYFYVVNGNGSGAMGWIYTTSTLFPNVYSFSRNSWLYFGGGTNFYNYTTMSWETY